MLLGPDALPDNCELGPAGEVRVEEVRLPRPSCLSEAGLVTDSEREPTSAMGMPCTQAGSTGAEAEEGRGWRGGLDWGWENTEVGWAVQWGLFTELCCREVSVGVWAREAESCTTWLGRLRTATPASLLLGLWPLDILGGAGPPPAA